MTFGMQIFDADSNEVFSTDAPNVSFYYGNGAPSGYPAGRIAYTYSEAGTRLGWSDYGIDNKIESTDYVNSSGAINAPSMTAGIGSAYNGSVVGISTSVASFGADPGAQPDFALDLLSSSGAHLLSYLMPFSAYLEHGSISIVTPNIGNNGVQRVTSYTAGWSQDPPAGNKITFSRALDNPPFIFLTSLSDESVRVALYKFTKDGAGKFTGAYLTCAFKDGDWLGNSLWWWRNQPSSVTVGYVIVENDKPAALPEHGVAVYDSAGGLIYTSEVFPLRIVYAANIARPRVTAVSSTFYAAGLYSTSLSLGSTATGTSWDSAAGNYGIMLNPTQGVTGVAAAHWMNDGNYQAFVSACGCFVGLATSGTVVTPTLYYDVHNTLSAYAVAYSYYSHAAGIDTNPFPVIVGDFTGAF